MLVFYSSVCKLGDLRVLSFVSSHMYLLQFVALLTASPPCSEVSKSSMLIRHSSQTRLIWCSREQNKLAYRKLYSKYLDWTIFSRKLLAFLKYIFRCVLRFYQIMQSTTYTNSCFDTTFINQILFLFLALPATNRDTTAVIYNCPQDLHNILMTVKEEYNKL